jgi:site-specific recombinase XerD
MTHLAVVQPPDLGPLATLTDTERNPAAVYLAALGSPKSRRAMLGALRRILRALGSGVDPLAFPWASIRYEHATVIRSALVAHHGPATVNQALCALRGVLHQAFLLRLIPAEDWAMVREVKGVKYQRLPRGRAVAPAELTALFAACDRSDPIGIRDAAILAVLRVGGLRRAELCAADLASLDRAAGSIRVIGKGDKERLVHLGEAMTDVEAWLLVRGEDVGAIFTSFDPTAEGPTRLSETSIHFILCRLASRAMVKAISPHDMRRTFISDLLDAGADISTIQKMAGHSDITTTERYDLRGENVKRKAAALLTIPR